MYILYRGSPHCRCCSAVPVRYSDLPAAAVTAAAAATGAGVGVGVAALGVRGQIFSCSKGRCCDAVAGCVSAAAAANLLLLLLLLLQFLLLSFLVYAYGGEASCGAPIKSKGKTLSLKIRDCLLCQLFSCWCLCCWIEVSDVAVSLLLIRFKEEVAAVPS